MAPAISPSMKARPLGEPGGTGEGEQERIAHVLVERALALDVAGGRRRSRRRELRPAGGHPAGGEGGMVGAHRVRESGGPGSGSDGLGPRLAAGASAEARPVRPKRSERYETPPKGIGSQKLTRRQLRTPAAATPLGTPKPFSTGDDRDLDHPQPARRQRDHGEDVGEAVRHEHVDRARRARRTPAGRPTGRWRRGSSWRPPRCPPSTAARGW